MKEKILKLRAEGKTYNEIVDAIGCSKGTVSYHCGPGQKQKSAQRRKDNRNNRPLVVKLGKFKARKKLTNKCRDFQRKRGISGVYLDGRDNIFTTKELVEKLSKNPYCYLTGDKIDLLKPSTYSLDHIIPVCEGGDNTIDNMGLTTRKANMSKGKMFLNEYIELCKKVLIKNGYSVNK
jgi:hypothetical protein